MKKALIFLFIIGLTFQSTIVYADNEELSKDDTGKTSSIVLYEFENNYNGNYLRAVVLRNGIIKFYDIDDNYVTTSIYRQVENNRYDNSSALQIQLYANQYDKWFAAEPYTQKQAQWDPGAAEAIQVSIMTISAVIGLPVMPETAEQIGILAENLYNAAVGEVWIRSNRTVNQTCQILNKYRHDFFKYYISGIFSGAVGSSSDYYWWNNPYDQTQAWQCRMLLDLYPY